MYAKFDNKERKADYISALDWLINSGMVIKCNQITNSLYPIKAYEDDNNYKLYLSDIGLLRDIINATSIDVLMEGDYPYKGVLTENYVALELLKQFGELFYWTKKNDGQGNKSEVDFIVQINDKIVPIEVKSNKNQAKSLKEYNDLFHPELSSHISWTGRRPQHLAMPPEQPQYAPFYRLHLVGSLCLDDAILSVRLFLPVF